MGKLGKKARKFAKKNLQSVLKTRRKTKVFFKKKSSKGGKSDVEEPKNSQNEISNRRDVESEVSKHISLGDVFVENENNGVADLSESDGYLSEDSNCPCATENGTENCLVDEISPSKYSSPNQIVFSELAIEMKKLKKIKKKDPEFSKFLEIHNSDQTMQNNVLQSEQDASDQEEPVGDDLAIDKEEPVGDLAGDRWKPVTNGAVSTWCEMIKNDRNRSSFISLLNAYRTACRYGAGSVGHKIESSNTFCSILIFTLSNANEMFQVLLQLPSLNNTKETLVELKKSSKFESVKPLIKAYFRSTLFLLNQVTDEDILAFIMTKLRASLILLVPLPSIIQRLLKVSVNLWASSGNVLSSSSYLVIRDVTVMFGSNYFDTCLSKTCLAYLSRSRVTEIGDIKHIQCLRDSIVSLCSLNIHKSSLKATASVEQLTKIMHWGVQSRKKEALKRICSWEYVNCIDLWVRFISANIHLHDLQSLLFQCIHLVNALAHMFPTARYFPLRCKCIGWLNSLCISSGSFIPLTSLVLDILEYKVPNENDKVQNSIDVATVLKLPKHYLKTRHFQEECLRTAIEQLSIHFAYWSDHISFPDLASITLIRLKKFYKTTSSEGTRRSVKRLIDQVEQNVNSVQKRRDDVTFSPHDHGSVESFLKAEKPNLNCSFSNYYRSIQEKAAERSLCNI